MPPRRPGNAQRRPEWPRVGDIVIAVMGMTGAGKSSFIDQFRPQRRPRVSHGLDAGTIEVDMYRCHDPALGYFWLIDTPGFNDQTASDAQILERIAAWMYTAYLDHILLAGIIYLHSIAEPRFSGSSRRNVDLFRRLCGRNALRKVLLVTSFWDTVPEQLSERRAQHNERELKVTTDFWGRLIRGGAKTERHDHTLPSARCIIENIIAMRTDDDPGVYTDLQEEMNQPGRPLNETTVGREIQRLLNAERITFENEMSRKRRAHEDAMSSEDQNHGRDLAALEAAHRRRETRQRQDQDILSTEVATLEARCRELQEETTAETRRQNRVQMTVEEEEEALRGLRHRQTAADQRRDRRKELRKPRNGAIVPQGGWGGAWVRKKRS